MFQKLCKKLGFWLIGAQDIISSDQPESYAINHTRSSGIALKGSPSSSRSIEGNGINFSVFPAAGGKVIQFMIYDPVKDRHNTKLYIVTDKENLGEELAQIITMETLSH